MTEMVFMQNLLLGFVPFLDPIPYFSSWFLLLIPIIYTISIVYKALKLDPLENVLFEGVKLTSVILVYLCSAAVVLYVVTEILLVS